MDQHIILHHTGKNGYRLTSKLTRSTLRWKKKRSGSDRPVQVIGGYAAALDANTVRLIGPVKIALKIPNILFDSTTNF